MVVIRKILVASLALLAARSVFAVSYGYPNVSGSGLTTFTLGGTLSGTTSDTLAFLQTGTPGASNPINMSTATIALTSGTGPVAISGSGGTWTVNNSFTTSSGGDVAGFQLQHNGNFTFNSSVLFTNTLSSTSSGTVTVDGIYVKQNASTSNTITNNGSITAQGSASSNCVATALKINSANGQMVNVINNTGATLSGIGTGNGSGRGIQASSSSVQGTLTNYGTISASGSADPSNYGVVANFATINNYGTITATAASSSLGIAIFTTSSNMINNYGTISGSFNAIDNLGSVINNYAGTMVCYDDDCDAISGGSAVNLSGYTSGGAGTITGGIYTDSDGTVEFMYNPTYLSNTTTVSGAINTGTFQVDSGATAILGSSVSSTTFTNYGTAIFQNGFNQSNVGTFTMGTGSILAFDSNTASLTNNLTGGSVGTVAFGQITATTNFSLTTNITNFQNTVINSGSTVTIGSSAQISTTAVTVAGTLVLGSNSSLGSSNLVLAGGILQANTTLSNLNNSYSLTSNSTISGTSNITLSGAGNLGTNTLTIANTSSTSTTLSGGISNTAGGITVNSTDGTGQLILSGTNSYSGTTTITNGTLLPAAANAFSPNSAVSIANASTAILTLVNGASTYSQSIGSLLSGGASGSTNIVLGTGTLSINQTASGTNTFAGAISGSGGLTITGANSSVLALTNANPAYSGITTISSGATLAIGAYTTLGTNNTATSLTMNGGTLIANSTLSAAVANPYTLTANLLLAAQQAILALQ